MRSFKVHILAASHTFYDGECESLIVPTPEGQYGIQAGHSNAISAVIPGKMLYRIPGEETKIAAVSSGMVKVENNEVLVLVDSAERPEDIDRNRAEAARIRAAERLQHKQSMHEYYQTKIALDRAMQRLQTAAKYKR